jgi:hypothetical protein
MDRENIPVVSDENRIESLLANIQPVPSEQFHKRMKQAAWRFEDKQGTPGNLKLKLAIVLTVLMLLASLFATPQGRAWAQEVFHFFARIDSETAELPESTRKLLQDNETTYDVPLVPVFIPTVSPEVAALPGCETAQASYTCQVDQAESRLGFDLKELPKTPEGWKFDSVSFMTSSKSASIRYLLDFSSTSYGTFGLIQGEGASPRFDQNNPWSVVPADKVKNVKVGNHEAEYVNGSFSLYTGSNHLTWDDMDGHQRLAWSDGIKWYLIDFWPNLNSPERIGLNQLIEMAESLVDTPPEASNALDPDYLYSVSDAETISGLDLKAPTLLPIEKSFSHARYFSDNKQVQVRLFYGVNNELVIYEQKARSVDFSTPKGYEIVKVNGRNAFYGADKEGGDLHQFLWWEADGLSYQMHFYQYLEKLDQGQMIAIAESMQDVNDFHTNESRPYEYVSIYAKALGFNALEFPEPPAGLSYVTVFGDPEGRCIYIIYKSVAEPASLFLHQCATGKRFNVADIPSSMAQQVKIGNHQGIYAEGSFMTQANGQILWNPDPTQKQLYWQENGLWIDMSISGIDHNKEDLISYAESLR